ncbi:two-component system response regulator [Rhodanobacter aciditrophus]|uniref:Two-component system response regulator n=1 Tax=Rhodanobacter aciditrophus TaxID=1623218 RepID=A0ABW4AWN0_9GAMM
MIDQPLKTVLVIDDEPMNIKVISGTLKDKYRVLVAKSGQQAFERLEQQRPDLILLDIMMPEMDGYEVCRTIKAAPATATIPIIFVTAMSEHVDEEKGFAAGAVDYITKPISPVIIQARIKNILDLMDAQQALTRQNQALEQTVAERTSELRLTQHVTIQALASLAETRDNETGNHIRRTQYYVKALAEHLASVGYYQDELTPTNIDLLFRSAPLHDIGKVGIPDNILLKPGKLTPEEFEIMKSHASLGAQALLSAQETVPELESSFLRYAREIAAYHHEKWDGSGYPYQLAGHDIPIAGRIMALADVYDALISERIYKPAFSHEKAKAILLEGKGRHFDPNITDAFMAIEETFVNIAQEFKD